MRLMVLILMSIVFFSFGAGIIAPHDPLDTSTRSLQGPDSAHLLGTDSLGRDVFSRLLFGGRRTLIIAMAASTLATVLGGFLGLMAGYSGGTISEILDLVITALLAIPGLILMAAVVALIGTGSRQTTLAIGFAQIAPFAQVVRASTKQARILPFVEGAQALGGGPVWILRRHVLPTVAPVLNAYAVVTFSYAIINSAALSFLGLGGDPGIPDWGNMLAEGRAYLQTAPWTGIAPGVMIFVTVLAVNQIADFMSKR